MLSNLKFAALVAAVAVLATTLWQVGHGQTAAAKPPVKAGANISKAEVWETWPFQDSDEYVGHEKCGAPIAVHKWDRNGWVNYHKLCVKVTVKARCGCTKLTTTYIKYEGEAKWLHGTVNSESEEVTCPVPVAKEVIAQCKAEVEAKKTCRSLKGCMQKLDQQPIRARTPSGRGGGHGSGRAGAAEGRRVAERWR